MGLPLQIDGFSGISLLHRASNARYYAAQDAHGEPRLLVVFELRRGLALEEQREAFSLRARSESPQLEVLRGPETLGRVWGFLRSQPGVVYEERGGIPLAVWLQRHAGPVPMAQALGWTTQLLEVLTFAHGRGVLHRALSPSTIWVEDQPELQLRRVFGFGFANLLEAEESWSRTGTMLGEVEWMAPEQFLGTSLSPSTDLYTIGLLLYRLATGTPAVEGTSVYQLVQAHCNPVRATPSAVHGMSPELLATLQRAMQREPRQRFATAADFLQALQSEAQRVTNALPAINATAPQVFGGTTTPDVAVNPSARLTPSSDEQEFYASQQATETRDWVPGHATSVDRRAVLSARAADERQREKSAVAKASQHSADARPRRRTAMIVASLVVVIAAIAGLYWLFAEPTDEETIARREAEREATPAVVGLPERFCGWELERSTLLPGAFTILHDGDREIVVSYDGEMIGVNRTVADEDSSLAKIPAPNGAALYQYRLPEAQRDWLFILPNVAVATKPTFWGLQFQGGDLLSQHRLLLSSASLADAHVSMPRVGGDCLLQLRVREGLSADAPVQRMRLRMVEQGLVVESGALGQLHAKTP